MPAGFIVALVLRTVASGTRRNAGILTITDRDTALFPNYPGGMMTVTVTSPLKNLIRIIRAFLTDYLLFVILPSQVELAPMMENGYAYDGFISRTVSQ